MRHETNFMPHKKPRTLLRGEDSGVETGSAYAFRSSAFPALF